MLHQINQGVFSSHSAYRQLLRTLYTLDPKGRHTSRMNEPVHGGSICACVVQMKKAEGGSKGIQRWLKRQQRRLSGKMLGIGDGANDVAMIQAADVGIGIMGKEGRQVTLTS